MVADPLTGAKISEFFLEEYQLLHNDVLDMWGQVCELKVGDNCKKNDHEAQLILLKEIPYVL